MPKLSSSFKDQSKPHTVKKVHFEEAKGVEENAQGRRKRATLSQARNLMHVSAMLLNSHHGSSAPKVVNEHLNLSPPGYSPLNSSIGGGKGQDPKGGKGHGPHKGEDKGKGKDPEGPVVRDNYGPGTATAEYQLWHTPMGQGKYWRQCYNTFTSAVCPNPLCKARKGGRPGSVYHNGTQERGYVCFCGTPFAFEDMKIGAFLAT